VFELKTILLLFYFLSLEVTALFTMLFYLIYLRVIFSIKTKIQIKRENQVSKKIASHLQGSKLPAHEGLFSDSQLLLLVLESFNHRLKGEEWEKLKYKLVSQYLLKVARKRVSSFSWRRRNFAARVFALLPLQKDERSILSLLNDSVFLVKSTASLAAVRLSSEEGIHQILKYMASAYGYSRCFYRDILLQGSLQTFTLIQNIASHTKDPSIHLACLDVFSGQTTPISLPFLLKDLQSKDPQILLAALKILSRTLLKNAKAIFLSFLKDPREEIRVEAAAGLKAFVDTSSLKALEKSLADPSWKVRLQVARSLKEMGKKGEAILRRQNIKKNQTTYEIAKYALDFLV